MKRVLILILAMMMAFASFSALGEEPKGADLSYDRAAQMGVYMRELVMGDYLDIKQTPESLKSIAQGWAAGITDKPRLVVRLDVENQANVLTVKGTFSQEPPIVSFEAVSDAEITIWQCLAMYAGSEGGVTGASYEEIMRVNGQINAATMYAEEGREVEVLWGRPGTHQMRVRATVTLFPYIKEGRNDSFDTETIPHPSF